MGILMGKKILLEIHPWLPLLYLLTRKDLKDWWNEYIEKNILTYRQKHLKNSCSWFHIKSIYSSLKIKKIYISYLQQGKEHIPKSNFLDQKKNTFFPKIHELILWLKVIESIFTLLSLYFTFFFLPVTPFTYFSYLPTLPFC